MDSENNSIVQFNLIRDMLDDDPEYIIEFCEAAKTSFSLFRDDYVKSMWNRELEDLRTAGHRIKPVAQMIGVNQLINEYEEAKQLLRAEVSDDKIQSSVEKVKNISNDIIGEFDKKIEQLNNH